MCVESIKLDDFCRKLELSESTIRRLYIRTGLVKTVKFSPRSKIRIVKEDAEKITKNGYIRE